MKSIGFKAGRDELYVGDIVAVYDGNCGYMKVIERDGQYWLTRCSSEVLGAEIPEDESISDIRITRDLGCHYSKRDKDNPQVDPPVPLYCDQCEETITGYWDPDTADITWNSGVYYTEKEQADGRIEITSKCALCQKDPNRKPPEPSEVMKYFAQEYEKLNVCLVPGHWPNFKTKEEVDKWVEFMKKLDEFHDKLWPDDSSEEK